MKLEARALLLSPIEDVWRLVGEPYHLPDYWPGYRGVRPDKHGLAEGARWAVTRGSTGGGTSELLRRPGGEGVLVIRRVVPGSTLAWHDVQLGVDCRVELAPAAERRTEVRATVEGPWLRITFEGLRGVPKEAVRRLYDLCQTSWPDGEA
jgi:uncharacterized protein YndB with AHSA1/START domain